MLKVIGKKGALKVFYYLMALDEVTSSELDSFMELGSGLLGEGFNEILDEVVNTCDAQISKAINPEDKYDAIVEGVSDALEDIVYTAEEGVVPRLLVWDLLTLANCDDEYSSDEGRLIRHIIRVLQIDPVVYKEMEQLIATANSIQNEQQQLELSNRPYGEIRALVDRCEDRRKTIFEAAKDLIEDDIVIETKAPEEPKENVVVSTGKKVGDKAVEVGKIVGEKAAPVAKEIGNTLKSGASKLFSKIRK